jgi:hypothetical protein
MGQKKDKKTLYLPDWLIELIDREGDRYDGPGILAGAAIWNFCRIPESERVKILQEYRIKEIQEAYGMNVPPAVQAQMDAVATETATKGHPPRTARTTRRSSNVENTSIK